MSLRRSFTNPGTNFVIFGESEEIRIYHVGIINITGFLFFCFIVWFLYLCEKKKILELQGDNNSSIKKTI